MSLSVLLPVYRNDHPEHLETSINSIVTQTRQPEELVIVQDGPIPDSLDEVVRNSKIESDLAVKIVRLERNSGLGTALRVGMRHCESEYVARMDADDLAVPHRFETQMNFLESNPEIDIVGSYITEFADSSEETLALRKVPTDHESIAKMARFRSPFNHGTVVLRRDMAMKAGNYRTVDRMEDWDLWSRMLLAGALGANIPEVLLKVRAGESLYERRGGWEYAREEIRQQVDFLRREFVTSGQFVRNLLLRVPLRCLPNSARGIIYKRFARE